MLKFALRLLSNGCVCPVLPIAQSALTKHNAYSVHPASSRTASASRTAQKDTTQTTEAAYNACLAVHNAATVTHVNIAKTTHLCSRANVPLTAQQGTWGN